MLENLDAVLLARIQFAFTVSFHIVFPALSIGLGSYLAALEGLWLATGEERYIALFRIWVKAFALTFGMGVVSGIVLSYEFGTNWSTFADKTGPVIGPLMGYEVLTAFFLEGGFLGIMLFGVNRVPKAVHFGATIAVAIGALLSAFWILAANSWMQTPAGYAMNDVGQFVPTDWFSIIFNPSFPYRLVHMVLAAYLATAFVVCAAGAYHLLKARSGPMVRTQFSMALWIIAVVAPIQLVAGDMHGLNTLEHQPAKIAAMEGHFEAEQTGAPLILFGLPDMAAGETRYALEVPKLGSLILTHSWNGTHQGPEELAARGLAARVDCLLELPPHGRPRTRDDRDRALQPLASLQEEPLRHAALQPFRALDGAFGPGRVACRLVRHGDRPSAVHRLRAAPDSRLRVSDRGAGSRRLAHRFCSRLRRRLRRRHLVPDPPHRRRS